MCCFGEEGRAQSFKLRVVVGLGWILAFGALRFEVAVASTASCCGGPAPAKYDSKFWVLRLIWGFFMTGGLYFGVCTGVPLFRETTIQRDPSYFILVNEQINCLGTINQKGKLQA